MRGPVTSSWCPYTGSRYLILSIPCILQMQLISEYFVAHFVWCAKEKTRPQKIKPSYAILRGMYCPLSPHMLSKRRRPASFWLLQLHTVPGTNFTSHGSLTLTENFRMYDRNRVCWLLSFHFSKIHAQSCLVLDSQSQSAWDDFHACTAWGNSCLMKIHAWGIRFSKACPRSEMHKNTCNRDYVYQSNIPNI